MIKRGNWKSGLVASSVWELRLCFGRWTLQCLCCEAVTIRWENKWKTSNQLLVLFIIKGEGRERSSQDFDEHFFKRCRWWYTCFNAILSEHHTWPSPTESQSLFCTSVSLFLFGILGYLYHLLKFHVYALVYFFSVYLSGLLYSV